MPVIRKLQGVVIVSAVALAVFLAWSTREEPPSLKPVVSIVSPVAHGKEARANPHNVESVTHDGIRPNSQTTGLRFDLKTREGRQAHYDDLVMQQPDRIWLGWDDAIARGDPNEWGITIPAMGYALRREGSQGLYNEMAERLYQSNRSVQERLFVIGALKHAATPEAARRLLEFIQAAEMEPVANGDTVADQQTLLEGVREALRLASREFIDRSRNRAISPALEDTWRELGNADALSTRATVSQAIVYLGRPEGVGALINSVSQGSLSNEAREITLSSIAQLSANESVPVLGKALIQSPPDSDLTVALVQGLVSVGSADAMREIANYLGQSDGFDKRQLREKIAVMLRGRNLSDEALTQ